MFEATHATLLRLYREGLIDGVRVDHVDGLADPPGYCRRLRARLDALAGAAAGGCAARSRLARRREDPRRRRAPARRLGGGRHQRLRLHGRGERAAARRCGRSHVARLCGASQRAPGRLRRSRRPRHDATCWSTRFTAQLDAVVGVAASHRHGRCWRRATSRRPRSAARWWRCSRISRCIAAMASARDREAARAGGRGSDEGGAVRPIIRRSHCSSAGLARRRHPEAARPLSAAERAARGEGGRGHRLLSLRRAAVAQRGRCRHASLQHRRAGVPRGMPARREHFPDAMLATATHDHKRGEDVRARLAVLSEIAGEWESAVRRWLALNAPHRRNGDRPMPSPGDEAMLYQMIVGAWPVEAFDAARTTPSGWPAGSSRRCARPSWRPTGTRRTWSTRMRARSFLYTIMADDGFCAEARDVCADRIGPAGAVNGLTQTLLKLTAPGVPDFYQGAEFWDQSLVDPDNRRPVDFAARVDALKSAAAAGTTRGALARRTREAGGDPARPGLAPGDADTVCARRLSAHRGDGSAWRHTSSPSPRSQGEAHAVVVVPQLSMSAAAGRERSDLHPGRGLARHDAACCPTRSPDRALRDQDRRRRSPASRTAACRVADRARRVSRRAAGDQVALSLAIAGRGLRAAQRRRRHWAPRRRSPASRSDRRGPA